MYCYIVNGGNKLNGTVNVSGSKNASLPILAASIISGKKTELYNLPEIDDVKTTLEILEFLGCNIKRHPDRIIIDSKDITEKQIPDNLMRKLRSSVILAGAMITRFHEAKFSYPGGCDIGSRPIDLHLKSFQKLGIKIDETTSFIDCKCDKILSNEIHLEFPSVGATENIILASVLGDHEVTIKNAAMEPEIEDLANFLNKMGARIVGAGTNVIKIKGVETLTEVSYEIMPDRIEAGTILIAGAITGGTVTIQKVIPEHIKPLLSKLEECGCKILLKENEITLDAPNTLKATDIKTMPYPGFPTDLQPIFSSLLVTAKGTSIVTENIFENRFKFVQELKRMGAKINQEGKTIIIKGTKKLHPAIVESTDLRGGIALVLAALSIKGTTEIDKTEYILRGYDNIDLKLNKLGANILRKEV
jgi:UDP-N-acetylglucosamine 1-carboxyvinyltransferase